MLAIKVTSPQSPLTAEDIQKHLSAVVEGRQVEASDEEVNTVTDWARVRKVYKVPVLQVKGGKKDRREEEEHRERKELEVGILAAMALRGAN